MPHGATNCTNGGEIWSGVDPVTAGAGCDTKFGYTNALPRHILSVILTKFSGSVANSIYQIWCDSLNVFEVMEV